MSIDSPSAGRSIELGSIEPDPVDGDAEAHLLAIQAEIDELFQRQRDYDPGTFAVLAWRAGLALTSAMERAWRARGVSEPEIEQMVLALNRRPGARPDA